MLTAAHMSNDNRITASWRTDRGRVERVGMNWQRAGT